MFPWLAAVALVLAQTGSEEHVVWITLDVRALECMPRPQIDAMTQEVDAIWREHRVSIQWTTARVADGWPDAHMSLTVLDASADPDAEDGMTAPRLGGIVFLEGRVYAEDQFWVSVASVAALVEGAPWVGRAVRLWPSVLREQFIGRALGRVVSHELGHYLLAWRGHSDRGLMRKEFTRDMLINPDRRTVEVSDEILPRLRVRLAQLAYAAPAMAAVGVERRDDESSLSR